MLVSDCTEHIIETSSTVVKDSLLHNSPQLSRIAWNHCYVMHVWP